MPHIIKSLREQSRNLDMDVQKSGDILAEVSVKGGSGYKHVVKLDERTCTYRRWQVSGIPCKHAIAFITSLREPLENYVDKYYSVAKFRAAYECLITVMPNKSQWPESDHSFFMHPPLLKPTSGRRQTKRRKGYTEANNSTTWKKGSHQCPICKVYGHRWYNCKYGDPEDIAAMLAEKGPPKRRKKNIEPSSESSILPIEPAPKTMHFPTSQGVSISLSSANSLRSGSGSNHPESLPIEYPLLPSCETTPPATFMLGERKKPKGKGKRKAKTKAVNKGEKMKKQAGVPPDSPAMSTRSKTTPQSPALHTRSKRKLPDLNL